jgi:hypothetical protein
VFENPQMCTETCVFLFLLRQGWDVLICVFSSDLTIRLGHCTLSLDTPPSSDPTHSSFLRGNRATSACPSRIARPLRLRHSGPARMKKQFDRLYLPLLALAVAIRLAILWIPRDSVRTPWSGGGDMDAYVLLARNLVSGNGYTYAHLPSAWRTPGYPLVIAGLVEVFGNHFPVAVRCFQLLASLAAAYFCMRAAKILFDETAGKIALVCGALLSHVAVLLW